jgi:hypothetical protein
MRLQEPDQCSNSYACRQRRITQHAGSEFVCTPSAPAHHLEHFLVAAERVRHLRRLWRARHHRRKLLVRRHGAQAAEALSPWLLCDWRVRAKDLHIMRRRRRKTPLAVCVCGGVFGFIVGAEAACAACGAHVWLCVTQPWSAAMLHGQLLVATRWCMHMHELHTCAHTCQSVLRSVRMK